MANEMQPSDAPADAVAPPTDANPVPTQAAARLDNSDGWCFAVTTAIALAVYWITLTPNMPLSDSGLFSVGAMYAGVPSPPGYPVWTIYSWLFIELLPFSNIAWRIAVGSAVASAAACGLVALIVSYGGRMTFCRMTAYSLLNPREQSLLRVVCGCVGGLVLGFSRPVWKNAVVVETHGLSLLLFVGALCFLMRWFFDPGRRRFLDGAFFLFGLLLTNSQELLVALPGIVVVVMLADNKLGRDLAFSALPLAALATIRNQSNAIWTAYLTVLNLPMLGMFLAVVFAGIALAIKTRQAGTEWRCALGCTFGLLLGLAFYFYLPLASMTNPPVNWGYPRTVEGFLHALGRGQFERVHPTENVATFVRQVWVLVLITGKQFGWLYLVLAVVPVTFLRWIHFTGRRWLLALLTIYFCVGFGLLAQMNPPSGRQFLNILEVYFTPTSSFVILAVLFGMGLIIAGAKMMRPAARISC